MGWCPNCTSLAADWHAYKGIYSKAVSWYLVLGDEFRISKIIYLNIKIVETYPEWGGDFPFKQGMEEGVGNILSSLDKRAQNRDYILRPAPWTSLLLRLCFDLLSCFFSYLLPLLTICCICYDAFSRSGSRRNSTTKDCNHSFESRMPHLEGLFLMFL